MIKVLLALWIGKIIFYLTRILNIGGGAAAPGYYALKIAPNLVSTLSSQIPQNIIITGTNGKTTTSKLLSHLIEGQNIKTVRNTTGSNLERGIASTLIENSNLFGKINAELGIWEMDEAAFNKTLFQIKPNLVVFLNAFRDQLDRYGEVDTVVKKWWDTLSKVNWPLNIVVNASDINTSYLKDITQTNKNIEALDYMVKDHLMFHEISMNLNFKKLSADIEVDQVNLKGLDSSFFQIKYPNGKLTIDLNLPGFYNIYNFLAAFSVYYLLNLPVLSVAKAITNFSPVFGRVEKINYQGKEIYIFLIKNPVGTSQVLETIMPNLKTDDILLIGLNDNFADGTDVSWIWDAEFERIAGNQYELYKMKQHQSKEIEKSQIKKVQTPSQILVTGARAYDMAVRLKYAGIEQNSMDINLDIEKSLKQALKSTKKRLFILPTYTSLLEIEKSLDRIGAIKAYWKK